MNLVDVSLEVQHRVVTLIGVAIIGLAVGFAGGLLGKGGSAIATPLLYMIGVPALAAIASPLPATIPATLSSGSVYRRAHLIDRRVVTWSAAGAVPATVVGATATGVVGGTVLVTVTEILLVVVGLRIAVGSFSHGDDSDDAVGPAPDTARPERWWTLLAVGIGVGLASGALGNSGGFLFAPIYSTAMRMPIRRALGNSLGVSVLVAIPGTIAHAALGHIDWTIAAVLGAAAVPASRAGARLAMRTGTGRLELLYGLAIAALGGALLSLG